MVPSLVKIAESGESVGEKWWWLVVGAIVGALLTMAIEWLFKNGKRRVAGAYSKWLTAGAPSEWRSDQFVFERLDDVGRVRIWNLSQTGMRSVHITRTLPIESRMSPYASQTLEINVGDIPRGRSATFAYDDLMLDASFFESTDEAMDLKSIAGGKSIRLDAHRVGRGPIRSRLKKKYPTWVAANQIYPECAFQQYLVRSVRDLYHLSPGARLSDDIVARILALSDDQALDVLMRHRTFEDPLPGLT